MTRSFKLKPSTVHERFGEESVILNLDSGSYYSVQGAGGDIWDLVAVGASEAEIVPRIGAEFTGSAGEIARATRAFLDQLVEEQLVDSETSAGRGDAPPAHASGTPMRPFVTPVLQKYSDMEQLLQIDPIHEVGEWGWPNPKNPMD